MSRGVGTRRAALLVTLALAIVGVQPAGASATSNHRVRHVTLTFVDHHRTTDDPNGVRSAPTRTLVTEVYVPRGTGRYPLVVMAHGNAGNPGKLTQLLTAWARAGYVVAAPTFPLTNDLTDQPSVIADYLNQPGDVRFTITEVLRQSHHRKSPLFHRVDAHHIGVAGHSLGGGTVYGVAYNQCCRDHRIDAVVTMDAVRLPFDDHRYAFRGTPLLMIHIKGDPVVPYSMSRDIYAVAAPPKYLMTLNEGIHYEPYENAPSPHDAAVIRATTAFWNAYLKGVRADRHRVVAAGTEAGLSDVTAQLR
jgi:dienelactone hydrolase